MSYHQYQQQHEGSSPPSSRHFQISSIHQQQHAHHSQHHQQRSHLHRRSSSDHTVASGTSGRIRSSANARALSPSPVQGTSVAASRLYGSASVLSAGSTTSQAHGEGSGAPVEWMSQYVDNGYRTDDSVPALRDWSFSSSLQKPNTKDPPGGIGVLPQSYVMHQELGSGGAGKAFLVTGKLDGKRYVAKQIICLGDKYKAAPASYALHETRLLFLLQHPHVVELRDFYPKSANYFIVMEFCENGDLGNQIETAIHRGGTRFDPGKIFLWWYQILDGIDYCHSKGIIHRDLKPKNIFLDGRLNVKIGDFGVSALISFPPAVERVGTVTYHAPEVTSALQYSPGSDVWSIGCIMWEAMLLRPQGGEPVNLTNINLTLIPIAYGSPARELLVMHLQNDAEHRPSASALKESMLQKLAMAGRSSTHASAEASTADALSAVEAKRAFMTPRHISVPTSLDETLNRVPDDGKRESTNSIASDFTERLQAESPAHQLRHSGGAASRHDPGTDAGFESGNEGQVSYSKSAAPSVPMSKYVPHGVEDSTEGSGLRLAAGEGGEFGAWKIVNIEPGSPAASVEIRVGEYLWEVDGKVIFGMPHQLIASMFRARPHFEVRLGLKQGLGLPIRHIVLPRQRQGDTARFSSEFFPNGTESSRDVTALRDPSAEPQQESITRESSPSLELQHQQNLSMEAQIEVSETSDRGLIDVVSQHVAYQESGSMAFSSSAQHLETPSVETVRAMDRENSPGLVSAEQSSGIAGVNLSPKLHPSDIDLGAYSAENGTQPEASREADMSGSVPVVAVVTGVATIAGEGEYSGEVLDGKPFGWGTATWPNQGHTYVGEWRNGVMHGQGTATYLNGDRYDGEWSQGKRNGLGRYAHGSGDVYEGLWSNERKHGLGVDTFADGRGFRGEFKDNKFAGVGSYFTVDGAVYQGDWYQGKAHGTGFSINSHRGIPAFVEYSHGNLISSDLFNETIHGAQKACVEAQSRGAIAVALLARNIASSIQGFKIPPPVSDLADLEENAVNEYLPPRGTATCVLGKGLLFMTGIRSGQREDAVLLVEGLHEDIQALGPFTCISSGDFIVEVARRSCSWYNGMTMDEIVSYLQGRGGSTVEIGIQAGSTIDWVLAKRLLVPKREQGYVV